MALTSLKAKAASSLIVRLSVRFMVCGRYPILCPLGTATSPDVGCCHPARIFNRVDLPAPFFPVRATCSLSLMTNVASEKRGRALNSTFKWDTEIMMLVVSSMFDNV